MANEISVNLNFACNNPSSGGGFQQTIPVNRQYNQNVVGQQGETVTLTTTAATISLSGLATPGWAFFQNLDATNNLQIGVSGAGTFYPFCTLEPGEIALFRITPGAVIQAKAVAGTPILQYNVIND